MTEMKSFRLRPEILQMLKELVEDSDWSTSTDIIQHAIWSKYEKRFGTVGAKKLRELEEKWLNTHESSKSGQGVS